MHNRRKHDQRRCTDEEGDDDFLQMVKVFHHGFVSWGLVVKKAAAMAAAAFRCE